MKVLIEAYSCEPGEGSEKGVGWNVVCHLASGFQHQLAVITRSKNKEKIEREEDPRVQTVDWIFVEPPACFAWVKQRGSIGLRVYNLLWQREMKKAATLYLESHEVDVLHRLTFGSILPPSLLAGFNHPLVVGPAGGAEMSPSELVKDLPLRLWLKDRIRAVLFRFGSWLPSTRKAYRSCEVALGATDASVAAFKRLGASMARLVPQSGCGDDEVEAFARSNPVNAIPPGGSVKLLTACRLVHWKAIDLAIEAVKKAVENGTDVELTILGSGPERKTLEAKVAQYGLTGQIQFAGKLPTLEDVYQLMRSCDALIHPALNEAFGQAVLESLALGRQVICLDWAGPGMIVTDQCGIKVKPGSREEVVSGLAGAISSLPARRLNWEELQEEAIKRSKAFSWQRLAGEVDQAYRDSVGNGDENPT